MCGVRHVRREAVEVMREFLGDVFFENVHVVFQQRRLEDFVLVAEDRDNRNIPALEA